MPVSRASSDYTVTVTRPVGFFSVLGHLSIRRASSLLFFIFLLFTCYRNRPAPRPAISFIPFYLVSIIFQARSHPSHPVLSYFILRIHVYTLLSPAFLGPFHVRAKHQPNSSRIYSISNRFTLS